MVASKRYLEKFTSIGGGTPAFDFPLEMYEYEQSQQYRSGLLQVVGADYPYDPMIRNSWPKAEGIDVVRFVLSGTNVEMDDLYDRALNICRLIGLGQLWSINAAGVRRWCYAKLAQRPSLSIGPKLPHYPAVSITFVRLSDWFGETPNTGSASITLSSQIINITNNGNESAKFIVFRLRSNSATGFTNPAMTNNSNGMSWSTTRDAASVDSELRIDTERNVVEFSTNNGSSYSPDYANFTIPSTQVGIMELGPGTNNITMTNTGTPNYSLEWSFYDQYH